jgi:integrase/recombinase XerD
MRDNSHLLASAALVTSSPADDRLIDLWLGGKAIRTQRGYRREIARFRRFRPKSLAALTLEDVHDYARQLEMEGLAPATQARALAAIKSLLGFGARIGVLSVDVGRPVRLPKVPDTLAERLLAEDEVARLLGTCETPRERVLLRLLYYAALRISEVVALRWRNCQARKVKGVATGQVTVTGKGGKTGTILLPPAIWGELVALRGGAGPNDPVFPGRGDGCLSACQGWRVVKAVVARSGLDERTSSHFLRHSHATHALHRGVTIDEVSRTLRHSSLTVTSRYVHASPDSSSGMALPTL